MPKLFILGAGGHGKVVADAAQLSGQWEHIAFLDDRFNTDKQQATWPIVGATNAFTDCNPECDYFVVAIGDVSSRMHWVNQLQQAGYSLATIIHPTAVISSAAVLSPGCVVMANVVVNHSTTIGLASIVNTSSSVDHDCVLAAGVHVCPGVHLAGNVTVAKHTWIGIGASVIQGISIGAEVTVGAGAVVVDDVQDQVTVVGIPAKPIKDS